MDETIVIGRVIRNVRREKGLSQFHVASRSGINLSYYCKLEGGQANPSIRVIFAVTHALGISPAQFLELIALETQYFLVSGEVSEPA